MNLLEIAEKHKALSDTLHDLGHDEQTILDTLEAESDLLGKAEMIAGVIFSLEEFAMSIDNRIEAMKMRSEAMKRRAHSIRSHLLLGMQIAGVPKIESHLFCISVAKNPNSVSVDDIEAIPGEYLRTRVVTEPDKRKILDAFGRNVAVPGTSIKQTNRLMIK